MNEILQQLGDLLLGAVPTMLLFLFLVVAYRLLVHGPLTATLAERRARTTGAVEKAQAAIAEADAKAQEYAAQLRTARIAVLKSREERVRQWNAEREHALDAVRKEAQEKVRVARTRLEADVIEARRTIESSADQLAGQILNAVLASPAENPR